MKYHEYFQKNSFSKVSNNKYSIANKSITYRKENLWTKISFL